MGTGWTKSTVKRARWRESAAASMARAISADGGPPCWCSGRHGPRVRTEGMKREPSCSKKAEGSLIRGSGSPAWGDPYCHRGAGSDGLPLALLAENDLAGLRVRRHRIAFLEGAFEQLEGERVLYDALDGPLQRAGAVHGIVAFLG